MINARNQQTKNYIIKLKHVYIKGYPKHSAYRSGLVVKEYKAEGGKYTGDKSKGGLTRWFKEDWKNQRGETGYKKKGDIYRPTKRVSKRYTSNP